MNSFDEKLRGVGRFPLVAGGISTVQANIALMCNQRCRHCHWACGAGRTEVMDWPTMQSVGRLAERAGARRVDITGGEPSLHPELRRFVDLLSGGPWEIRLRTNFTGLLEDGKNFQVDAEPAMVPSMDGDFAIYERKGIEDPRITQIDGVYYIMYTAASGYGPRLALAKTTDFARFERIALISEPDNKDGTLFPRKIGGRYARLDRPMVGDVGNIWISYSDDLIHWGGSKVVLPVFADCWDSWRVGASAQPIETRYGWLEIYHGARATSHGPVYRLGAADTCICMGTAQLGDLMQFCAVDRHM